MHRLARPITYLGVVGIVFAASKYHASEIGTYDFTDSSRFAWAICFAAIMGAIAFGLGIPDVPVRSRFSTATLAAVGAALGMSAVQLVVGDALLPRFVVMGSALVAIPWFAAMATLASAGRSARERRDRVLVVGSPDLAAEIEAELGGQPERPAALEASLSVAEAAVDDTLWSRAREERITVVVLDAAAQAEHEVIRQAGALHEQGVRIRPKSWFYTEWLGKVPVADLERDALFFDIGEVHAVAYRRVKRLFDIGVGIVGTVPLAVVVAVVWVGNRIGNRGPLFYRQERVGQGGIPFTILKFRSMVDSPETPTQWTAADDPRVTPFGRLLRVSHLDELPQVWNILRGDLSLVGPRPEQPHYVAELSASLPFYDLRHAVRPGLTGWAQIKYGYAGDERDALEKLQYDFYYLQHQSPSFDLRIAARTVRSVLGGAGAGR